MQGGPSVAAWGLDDEAKGTKMYSWLRRTRWLASKKEDAVVDGVERGEGMKPSLLRIGKTYVRSFGPSRKGVGDY